MKAILRSLGRVSAMASKETMHIQRDPMTLYLGLVLPLVMLVLFGYGVRFDLEAFQLRVDDQDNSPASRALVADLTATGELTMVGAADAEDAVGVFARREAQGVITVPKGYSAALARRERASVALQLDAADVQTTQAVLGRTEALGQVVSARVAGVDLGAAGAAGLPVGARVSTWYNPAGRSALFLVPGLTAYVLALVAVLLTSLSVAREWERGSMEQLFGTPVGRFEILAGKLLPYLAMGVVQVLLVLTAGAWVFGVPVRGDLTVLAAASVLFLMGMLGQGLLISVVARNQMVATQAATMSSMLPTMLLSGFLFPIANMPAPLQLISRLVPARYYIVVLRGVLLKGNGWAEAGEHLIPLAAFVVLMFGAATARFPRRLA